MGSWKQNSANGACVQNDPRWTMQKSNFSSARGRLVHTHTPKKKGWGGGVEKYWNRIFLKCTKYMEKSHINSFDCFLYSSVT
jgi:hypothetical protein